MTGSRRAPGDVDEADDAGPDDGPAGRWRAAVELGGTGHVAAAAAILEALRRDPTVRPEVRAHAAVTRASHLRQLSGHRAAAVLDAAGLRTAFPVAAVPVPAPPGPAGPGSAGPPRAAPFPDTDAADAVADALTGLAADALGRFDARTAGRLLERAAPWCRPGGRSAVRHGWVQAETALVRDDPVAALAAAEQALAGALRLGSERHVLKSRLVRAVAAAVAGRAAGAGGAVAAAVEELDAVAARTGEAGLLPLRRAALLAAADLAPDAGAPGGGDRIAAEPAPDAPDAGNPDAPSRRGGADQGTRAPGGPAGDPARHAGASPLDTRSRRADAEGRRHAALHTVSVLSTRSDRPGRDLLRESGPEVPPDDVPYGLLHSATLHPHDAEARGQVFRTEGQNSP